MVGVLLAIAWIVIVAYETLFVEPRIGWYGDIAQVISESVSGVIALAALVWLIERSRILERS